jgi:hypothetical protein
MPDDGRPKQRSDQEPGLPKRASALRVIGALALAAACFALVWLTFKGWPP